MSSSPDLAIASGAAVRRSLLPPSATTDAARLIAARMVRAFADGMVSVLLPAYLSRLGRDAAEIGAIATATLLGSAVLTLGLGLRSHRWPAKALLLCACALMAATGFGFASASAFAPLLLIGFVGTLNPTAGDVSVFLPLEQSLLASQVEGTDLAALYARSNVAAGAAAALGAAASALPVPIGALFGLPAIDGLRLAFFVYALAAATAALLYSGLRAATATSLAPRAPLVRSRAIVLRLSALFTLDSFGGGFVAQSLLALWLFQRFAFSLADAAGFFFATSLLSGASQLLSPVLARRIGFVRTMVFTHLPANLFLIAAAFMPSAELAVTCLLLRMALASMDVPVRQAFVMSVVPVEERAAAAAVTNVPRSLGSSAAPLLSGYLLAASSFGWPLVIAGSLKVLYDLLLLRGYQHHVEKETQP
ncbi:MAG TPA: MFS transporter [Polyangiales bacterium]|nr:MFS transporter [Polyangiales bacterium]